MTRTNGVRVPRMATIFLGVLALVGIAPLPAAAQGDVRLVGKLPIIRPEGATGEPTLLLDRGGRRAFQVYESFGVGLGISVFDLDSLELVAQTSLPIQGMSALAVVDGVRGRIYIPYTTPYPATAAPVVTEVFGGIAVVNTRTLKIEERWENPPVTDFLRQIQVQVPRASPRLYGLGLYQPAGEFGPQKLLMVFQERVWHVANAHVARNLVYIGQWDARSGEQEWVFPVNSCQSIFQFTQTPFRTQQETIDGELENALFLACAAPGGGGIAVRVPLTDDGTPTGTEQSLPGPLFTENVITDPAADRILFSVSDEGKTSLFVFDGERKTYVGVIGVSKQLGVLYGIDEATGRFYALSQDNGLLVGDSRRTPAQQALVFPEFAGRGAAVDDIQVDPAVGKRARRAFVYAQDNPFYWVIEDTIEVSDDPTLADLDRFTVDQPEVSGVTGRTFEAGGHAYGVRALTVGGLDGVPPSGPQGTVRGAIRLAGSPCTRFDRELVAGLVQEVALSDTSAKGAAIAADADVGTKVDGTDPAERCWPVPDPLGNGFGVDMIRSTSRTLFDTRNDVYDTRDDVCRDLGEQHDPINENEDLCTQRAGTAWPLQKAECTGTDSQRHVGYDEPTGAGRRFTGFVADVSCDQTNQVVRGSARSGFDYPGATGKRGVDIPQVIVGDSSSNVTITAREGGGVVGVAEAEARNIQILGVGTIDLVSTRAVSEAAGRSGTAETDFERVICGVVVATFSQPGCADGVAAAAAIDSALGVRGRARLPDPDEELADGTPGGYLASVQKDRTEELSGRALSNDFSTQVPGLELILFNDTLQFGRARQIVQFAGVDVSTTYGIYLLGEPFVVTPPVFRTLGPFSERRVVTIRNPGGGGGAGGGPVTETHTITERIREGMSLVARSPGQAFTAIAVWLALGAPVIMGIRRLSLLRAIGGR